MANHQRRARFPLKREGEGNNRSRHWGYWGFSEGNCERDSAGGDGWKIGLEKVVLRVTWILDVRGEKCPQVAGPHWTWTSHDEIGSCGPLPLPPPVDDVRCSLWETGRRGHDQEQDKLWDPSDSREMTLPLVGIWYATYKPSSNYCPRLKVIKHYLLKRILKIAIAWTICTIISLNFSSN